MDHHGTPAELVAHVDPGLFFGHALVLPEFIELLGELFLLGVGRRILDLDAIEADPLCRCRCLDLVSGSDQCDAGGDAFVNDDPGGLECPLLKTFCEDERLARSLREVLHLL